MDKAQKLVKKIQDDPIFFMNNVLGVKPWSKQRQIIRSVNKNARTTVAGCHGFGKTFLSGSTGIQFLYTYKPSIVLTTAPTYRQVEKLVWKEIRTAYGNARVPLGGRLMEGRPLLQIVQDQWYAMGLATNDGDKFQGFHEENILVIVDEAAGIPESIYDAIEGLLTSANAHLLLIGNPTSVTGTFKKSFDEPGWKKYQISAFDTPNFKYYGIGIEEIATGRWKTLMDQKDGFIPFPKLITPQWVADKYRRWGTQSVLWTTRVEGQFADVASDTVIPLAWIEAANARYEAMTAEDEAGSVTMGVDVAEYGRDSSVIYIRKGRKVLPAKTFSQMPIMNLVGQIMVINASEPADSIRVDVIGVGTGAEGRLQELGMPTIRVNVGEAPGGDNEKEKEKFINKRAQLYWSLREQLNPDPNINPNPIALPPDEELEEELVSTRYKINSKGQIQIIPKDDIKAAIGRSPDKADALVMACAPANLLGSTAAKRRAGVWGSSYR